MKLDDLQVYQIAMEVGEKVWRLVIPWDYFGKDTVGKKLARSADSIASNISEGYGRYHYKDNQRFCYYARGSLRETITWLTKARNRTLISDNDYETLCQQLETLSVKLNNYIKSIGPTS